MLINEVTKGNIIYGTRRVDDIMDWLEYEKDTNAKVTHMKHVGDKIEVEYTRPKGKK
jgi:hypothetical protein